MGLELHLVLKPVFGKYKLAVQIHILGRTREGDFGNCPGRLTVGLLTRLELEIAGLVRQNTQTHQVVLEVDHNCTRGSWPSESTYTRNGWTSNLTQIGSRSSFSRPTRGHMTI